MSDSAISIAHHRKAAGEPSGISLVDDAEDHLAFCCCKSNVLVAEIAAGSPFRVEIGDELIALNGQCVRSAREAASHMRASSELHLQWRRRALVEQLRLARHSRARCALMSIIISAASALTLYLLLVLGVRLLWAVAHERLWAGSLRVTPSRLLRFDDVCVLVTRNQGEPGLYYRRDLSGIAWNDPSSSHNEAGSFSRHVSFATAPPPLAAFAAPTWYGGLTWFIDVGHGRTRYFPRNER